MKQSQLFVQNAAMYCHWLLEALREAMQISMGWHSNEYYKAILGAIFSITIWSDFPA